MLRQICRKILGRVVSQKEIQRKKVVELGLTDQLSIDELKKLPREALPKFVQACPVSMGYVDMLGDIAWKDFPHSRGSRGPLPMNRGAFVGAFIIKIDQGHKYMSKLRDYLSQHPALIWLLGFPLVLSDKEEHGFDVEKTLVCQRQFSRVLKKLDREQLEFMLKETVDLLAKALPEDLAFAKTVSLDTKHILAWVKENNPKAYVTERFDKEKQLRGDSDCKLGCKKKQSIRYL